MNDVAQLAAVAALALLVGCWHVLPLWARRKRAPASWRAAGASGRG